MPTKEFSINLISDACWDMTTLEDDLVFHCTYKENSKEVGLEERIVILRQMSTEKFYQVLEQRRGSDHTAWRYWYNGIEYPRNTNDDVNVKLWEVHNIEEQVTVTKWKRRQDA